MADPDGFGAKDIVTFIIAAYGAILSSIVFVRSVRKERRRIKVRAIVENGWWVTLSVVNDGFRPVIVNAPKFELANGASLSLVGGGYDDFPKQLGDGEEASLVEPLADLGEKIKAAGYVGNVALRPYCTDSVGNLYFGKKFRLKRAKAKKVVQNPPSGA